MKSYQILVIVAMMTLISCDKSKCIGLDDTFDKVELTNKIKSTPVRWWFADFIERDGNRFLIVDVQGDNLCAVIEMKITEENKTIEKLLKSHGMGYQGAELTNVKFTLSQDSDTEEFLFISADHIID